MFDKQLLHRTLSIQTVSKKNQDAKMIAYICDEADKNGASWLVDKGNIYVVKGQAAIYPCIVAHTDTVHDIVPDREFQVRRDGDAYYGWNPVEHDMTGVGGDDKVGIYIALAALRDYDAIKLAFFYDEEVGCVGSSKADLGFFTDCAFVLECDRKGHKDFVDDIMGVDLSGADFHEAVDPILTAHGYKRTTGGMTDVMTLKEDGLAVVCANMSCGYYNPHSSREWVSIRDVARCQALVYAIIDALGATQWMHTAKYTSYRSYGLYGWDDGGDWTYKKDPKTGLWVRAADGAVLSGSTPVPTSGASTSSKAGAIGPTGWTRTSKTVSDDEAARYGLALVRAKLLALDPKAPRQELTDLLDAYDTLMAKIKGVGKTTTSSENGASDLSAALASGHSSDDGPEPDTGDYTNFTWARWPDDGTPPRCPTCAHNGYVTWDDGCDIWACVSCETFICESETHLDDLTRGRVDATGVTWTSVR